MEDLLKQYVDASEAMMAEALKFSTKGNNAAGTRCRLLCQELKTTLTLIRNHIQTIKKEKN